MLPIDPSPLLISLATTCAATAATFFLGLLAARIMYGVRGSWRASSGASTHRGWLLSSAAFGKAQLHRPCAGADRYRHCLLVAGDGDCRNCHRFSTDVSHHAGRIYAGESQSSGCGAHAGGIGGEGLSQSIAAHGRAGRAGRNRSGLRARDGRIRRDTDAGRKHSRPHSDHADRHLLSRRGRRHARGFSVGGSHRSSFAGHHSFAEPAEQEQESGSVSRNFSPCSHPCFAAICTEQCG